MRRRAPRPVRPATATVSAVPVALVALLTLLAALLASVGEGRPAAALVGPQLDHPDPDVVRAADGQFYSFSTNVDRGGRRVHVPVWSSPDLATWTDRGDALPVPGRWAAPSSDNWAPSMAQLGGRFVLYYTAGRSTDGQFCIGRATSATPVGPYTDDAAAPLLCAHDGADGVIDPSVFVDANGGVWLHYKTTGVREVQLWAQPLSRDGLSLAGPHTHLLTATEPWENGGIENPEMVLDDGIYWLFYAANWWTDARYRTGLARCSTPAGPCTKTGPFRESDDTITGPGGASVVRDASGAAWIVSHGWRGPIRVQYVDALAFTRFGPVLDPSRTSPLLTPPFGAFDAASGVPGGVRVSGWAIDPDAPTPIATHVYVDGAFALTTRAERGRGDLASIYPASGAAHGFDAVAPAAPGTHSVCAYAINDGPAAHTLLGCRDATVPSGPPAGSVDAVQGRLGQLEVAGWAVDPDVATPIDLHVYVDGAFARVVRADAPRPDVGAVLPAYGSAHGFATRLPAAGGPHTVCVYGIDEGLGGNALIGCRVVEVPGGAPVGSLDVAAGGAGVIRVAGWAIDPDVAASVDVHVYVDGTGVSVAADIDRADLTAALGPYGGAHGFAVAVPTRAGTHEVCAYAIDTTPGVHTLLGCRRVTST